MVFAVEASEEFFSPDATVGRRFRHPVATDRLAAETLCCCCGAYFDAFSLSFRQTDWLADSDWKSMQYSRLADDRTAQVVPRTSYRPELFRRIIPDGLATESRCFADRASVARPHGDFQRKDCAG